MKNTIIQEKDALWHPIVEELERELANIELPDEDAVTRKHTAEIKQWITKCRKEGMLDNFPSGDSTQWRNIRGRLKLTVDESQQLTNEGGIPADKEQKQKIEDLLKVVRHIDKMLEHGA